MRFHIRDHLLGLKIGTEVSKICTTRELLQWVARLSSRFCSMFVGVPVPCTVSATAVEDSWNRTLPFF